MNKLKYLTQMSLKKKIATKWFYVANIILLVLVVGLINIDSIIKLFGGSFEKNDEIIIIDNTNSIYNEFIDNYKRFSEYLDSDDDTKIELYDKSLEEAKEEVKEDDKILLVIDNDQENFIKAEVITNKAINAITFQIITTSLNSAKQNMALEYFNISEDMLSIVNNAVNIERTRLDESKDIDETMELIMSVAFPILILPFFMLTLFLTQMIGAEVNEEKTTKSMEIIISNVSAKTHFFSKVIAGNVFVLFQGLLLVLFAILGLTIRYFISGGLITGEAASTIIDVIDSLKDTGFINNLVYIIPITLVLMILTFIAYSLLAGILASMTTNMEDYQQLQTPIIIISLVGYYLAMMAAMFEGSIFIRIASYIPFISSLLSPALLMLGQISIIDVFISLLLLIAVVFVLIKYGLRIYKVGILNYSSNHLWKKMFKAIKNKE